jgi:predicted dehydrogenase
MTTTTLAQHARVSIKSTNGARRISKVGFVGAGKVVQKKIWPALQSTRFALDGIVVCSLEPNSGLNGLPHVYHRVRPDKLLPLDTLYEQGFLSPETAWIIATPSEWHIPYVVQLAGLCGRIAVEKPIATDRGQARLLLPFAEIGFNVDPIDHKLFNASPLAFIDECRKNPRVLEDVHRIEGVFFETAGTSKGRQQEDCIADVQWHLLTILVAIFKTTEVPFGVAVDRVRVSSHHPDVEGRYAAPTVWTASRIQGQLVRDSQEVSFDLCQAKGVPKDQKHIRLFDGRGVLIKEIDLNESGWHAHARVLQALLQPVVDMRHTLADSIAVMELVDTARAIASEEPSYTFGRLPGFLT